MYMYLETYIHIHLYLYMCMYMYIDIHHAVYALGSKVHKYKLCQASWSSRGTAYLSSATCMRFHCASRMSHRIRDRMWFCMM